MNKAQYLEYIDHFNNKRYDKLAEYFRPDIVVEYFSNLDDPSRPPITLHGPQQFVDVYANLHQHVRETLELRDFLSGDGLVFAELYTVFDCFKDMAGGAIGPMKAGDLLAMTNWVLYNLDDEGKMARIRIAHFRIHEWRRG